MKQKSLSKFSLSRPVRWTELLEDKQYAKLGGVDTSQTYLLFQTLLILFWPHSCMIWTKLTRTDAVFSRAACMFYLCAGKRIFNYLRKIHEKSRKIHAPEETRYQKWGQRGARGCPGALWARPPWAAPRGRLGGPHTPWCPTLARIFPPDAETPDRKFFRSFSSRSRRHPLFFLGRANLEAELASGEGRSSPSSSSSPLHPPSMTSPSMCE